MKEYLLAWDDLSPIDLLEALSRTRPVLARHWGAFDFGYQDSLAGVASWWQ